MGVRRRTPSGVQAFNQILVPHTPAAGETKIGKTNLERVFRGSEPKLTGSGFTRIGLSSCDTVHPNTCDSNEGRKHGGRDRIEPENCPVAREPHCAISVAVRSLDSPWAKAIGSCEVSDKSGLRIQTVESAGSARVYPAPAVFCDTPNLV